MFRSVLFVLLIASQANAQDFAPRSGDVLFDQTALDNRVRGETLIFFDDGQSRFFDDGRYTYTYANDGGTGYGYFEVTENSTICVEFVTGFSRCDLYVTDAQGRLILITEAGDRFPIRP
ncbi:hypothetical protein MWU54_10000 [Marivita sp. S6314]|uniref:hypothetical protein n=1 Tax=Marivita sp. S6314 TaxID=2926406 RepID=UPI001FF2102B|nr:hypothetical protein [Marivita sp. S6314]MCK0150355.1 hypothetical protein [Marivita sp. S6314]